MNLSVWAAEDFYWGALPGTTHWVVSIDSREPSSSRKSQSAGNFRAERTSGNAVDKEQRTNSHVFNRKWTWTWHTSNSREHLSLSRLPPGFHQASTRLPDGSPKAVHPRFRMINEVWKQKIDTYWQENKISALQAIRSCLPVLKRRFSLWIPLEWFRSISFLLSLRHLEIILTCV